VRQVAPVKRPRARRFGRRSRVALSAAVVWLVLVSPAGAGTIGRANVDGSGVDQSFIPRPGSDPPFLALPYSIAVDHSQVYWTQILDDGMDPPLGIRRANLDGSRVETIVGGDGDEVGLLGAIAVGAGHLYWASDGGISRANLDGSAVERFFIPASAYDLVVAGRHIYWTWGSAIGRARLDGSGVEPFFITRTGSVRLAVGDRYIYWAWRPGAGRSCGGGPPSPPCRPPEQVIGRAKLDGSDVDRRFISDLPVGSSEYATAIAVDGGHIYWTDGGGGHIGRARVDGTHVEEAFIRNTSGPTDVAVAGGQLYWTNPQQRLISIVGSRLKLRRDRRTSVRLACPTLFSRELTLEPAAPCLGTVRLLTADAVRYRGGKRRVTLATARYRMMDGHRQTLQLRLSKRKAVLVRSNRRARTVRAIAEVDRPSYRAIVSEPMTMILAH
jgi:hypothetical protein